MLVSPVRTAFKGDPQAAALARRMIDHMGDRQAWAAARWIYTRERAYSATRRGPFDLEFWRATTTPAEWGRLTGPDFSRVYAWTKDGGWRLENGEQRAYTRDEMQSRLGYWPGEIYVMYHRLAKEDETLRLVSRGERAFDVLDNTTGGSLGRFQVASTGEIVKWSHGFGNDRVEYVYGPLKPFGKIRMPDWGAQVSGDFRFYYTDVQLRSDPAPPVSLTSQ